MFLPYGLHNITLRKVPYCSSTCHRASFQNTFSRLKSQHVSHFIITNSKNTRKIHAEFWWGNHKEKTQLGINIHIQHGYLKTPPSSFSSSAYYFSAYSSSVS